MMLQKNDRSQLLSQCPVGPRTTVHKLQIWLKKLPWIDSNQNCDHRWFYCLWVVCLPARMYPSSTKIASIKMFPNLMLTSSITFNALTHSATLLCNCLLHLLNSPSPSGYDVINIGFSITIPLKASVSKLNVQHELRSRCSNATTTNP